MTHRRSFDPELTARALALFLLLVLVPRLAAGEAEYGVLFYEPYDFPATELDDRTFDVGPRFAPETDAAGHPLTREPRDSRAQRREWARECERLKESDFHAFQQCFHDHREHFLHPERTQALAKKPHPALGEKAPR